MNPFWESKTSFLLLNPRTPGDEQEILKKAHSKFAEQSGFFIRSSGTESTKNGIKLVHLSQKAFLVAAKSVNLHLRVSAKDHWLNPLPLFHVGGLSVGARCFLSGARESYLDQWSVKSFHRSLKDQVTITSLVPTQVFDLIQAKLRPPKSLRLVLLGGGGVSQDLYSKALKLGWPLLPSYGMTETAAMMGGALLSDLLSPEIPALKFLDHIKFGRVDEQISIVSEALFTGYLWVKSDGEGHWQNRPNPFVLDDRLKFSGDRFCVLGRESEIVKILGESVNIKNLESRIVRIVGRNCAIVCSPDERRTHRLHLIVEGLRFEIDLHALNNQLMPYERVEEVKFIKFFPKSEMGKLKRSSLAKLI